MLDISAPVAGLPPAVALKAYADTTLQRSKRGQCVYSRQFGPAVYVGMVDFSSQHPENSRWQIQPLFNAADNKPIVVKKGTLQPPITRCAAVDVVNVLRGTAENSFASASDQQIEKILTGGNIEQMTSLLRWLHEQPCGNGAHAHYENAVNRVSQVLTGHVLLSHAMDDKQPSTVRPLFDEIHRRVVLALNGGLKDNDVARMFGFQKEDVRRFDLIAERTTVKQIATSVAQPAAVETAATTAPVAKAAPTEIWYTYPPKPQINPRSAPRELPPFTYPQRNKSGPVLGDWRMKESLAAD